MPTVSRTLASLGGMTARRTTISKLLKAKTISFFGGVCLLINGMTGPGVPFTPATFQQSGWFFPTILFIIFGLVSALSILFIIEAMQAVPGNKHFQGTVEFATLINFYFGDLAHYLGQFLLYGALQSNAMSGIVIMAQAFDSMIIDIFGKTCGLALSGPNRGWFCVVSNSTEFPSPFGDTWMLFTVGLLLVLIFAFPLGIVNLDDNIIAQIIAFWLSIAIGLEWIGASFHQGLEPSRVPAFGSDYATVVGTIMLNLACTTVVPSWVNIKKRTVSAQSVVWTAIAIATAFYMLVGLIPALGFQLDSSGNILPTLMKSGKLNKASAYLFSIVMLLPAIPVNFIVAQNNMVQNKVAGKRTAIFLAHVLPWFLCIPLQTGNSMQAFINWTSLFFVSTANFIIPFVIYLKCLRFRREYNESRILTEKQKLLLKEIHWSSRTIHKFIDEKSVRDSLVAPGGERRLPRDRSELSMRGAIPPLEIETAAPSDIVLPTLSIPPPIAVTLSEDAAAVQVPMPSPSGSILKNPLGSKGTTSGRKKSVMMALPDEHPVEEHEDSATLPRASNIHYEAMDDASVTTASTAPTGEGMRPSSEIQRGVTASTAGPWTAVRLSTEQVQVGGAEEYLKDDVPDPDLEHKIARRETHHPSWDMEGGGGVRGTLKRAMKSMRAASPSRAGASYTRPGKDTLTRVAESADGRDMMAPQDVPLEPIHGGEEPGPAPSRRETTGSNATDISDGADLLRKATLPVHPQYISPTFRSIPTWFPVRGRVVAWTLLVITGGISVSNIIIAIVARK
ncbi:uncharacterized protein SPPG_08240 [Spizellomyces punctatus DAOM BR117]|uniref:Amino acid transporter transmembrane domain-containing protein n=1 Tax=Spizellomyces punctatus (strain DAOM BR117) TaxID=645134 RepID=A0A0L0H6H6_SPIPD|nr:uncharacterized protein SPPG_08240 [Spizellomyces punctatus DAOM BR117]KNC96338.1 hypothetical protein SPPG_08240 [Spizellomyces punctatus DAOM BR117]|eukprot:XP_016604378.1 hypothetical protein SPPG_08240 [Spizellomyces punctatus DAOM BR117]